MCTLFNTKMVTREDICWTALALCVLKPVPIERAFEILAPDPFVSIETKHRFEDEEMAQLKADGLTWAEVGQMFGLSSNAAHKRVERFKRR